MELNKIYNQDCLEGMRELEENSIDALISDPPYQLSATGRGRPDQTKEGSYGKEVPFSRQQSRITKGFMGKDWDVLPTGDILKECLRVLKPGAWAMWCMTPRQDSYGIFLSRLSEAGFNIGFTSLYWSYGSGFPKAMNTQKYVGKLYETSKSQMCDVWKTIIQASEPSKDDNNRRDMQTLLAYLEQGEQCKIYAYASSKSESTKVSKRKSKPSLEGRDNILQDTWELSRCKICKMPTGISTDGKERWLCHGTQNNNGEVYWQITKPDGSSASYKSQAIRQQDRELVVICYECRTQKMGELDGGYAGFQPKPAIEIIVVSMKGMTEKSYIDQAMKTGKGITWLDNCRIPYGSQESPQELIGGRASHTRGEGYGFNALGENALANTKGRFPANLLVSNSILDLGKPTSSSSYRPPDKGGTGNSLVFAHEEGGIRGYDDSGDFSRYFSLDAWFDEKMKELPKEQRRTFPFLIEPKADKGERNEGLDKLPNGIHGHGNLGNSDGLEPFQTVAKNVHPSVKPISLMSYLITLTTKPREIILDPFMGSGTTAIAAHMMNRQFIGFEKEPDYHKIATERIAHYLKQCKLTIPMSNNTRGKE